VFHFSYEKVNVPVLLRPVLLFSWFLKVSMFADLIITTIIYVSHLVFRLLRKHNCFGCICIVYSVRSERTKQTIILRQILILSTIMVSASEESHSYAASSL